MAGVLRTVRLVFRTLELAGAALSFVFRKVWDGVRFILRPIVDLPAWDSLGSAADTLDAAMAASSERLRGSPGAKTTTSTPGSRAATVQAGNVYNVTINANNRDSTRAALQDAKIIPLVS
jgi:hypothetical protein